MQSSSSAHLVALVIAKPYRHAMKLIFIHGAPASRKLTVARALLRAVPGRLFDNHAPIDLARTVFDFGAPGFWSLWMSSGCRRWTSQPGTEFP
jgi:hypothetical protein